MIGFKYKISNIQAAIGCAQIERIDELTKKKREILASYRRNLLDIPGLNMNPEPTDGQNGGWMPTVVFDKKLNVTREALIEAFKKENIDARVFFWPLSSLNFFDTKIKNKKAWDISSRSINLPSYFDITESDINRVLNVIKNLIL
jgi:perosamine synthetase